MAAEEGNDWQKTTHMGCVTARHKIIDKYLKLKTLMNLKPNFHHLLYWKPCIRVPLKLKSSKNLMIKFQMDPLRKYMSK